MGKGGRSLPCFPYAPLGALCSGGGGPVSTALPFVSRALDYRPPLLPLPFAAALLPVSDLLKLSVRLLLRHG